MSKVSILDLTVAQVEAIETAIGVPMSKWAEAPSQAALYAQVLAAATGEDVETLRARSMRDLLDMVSLDASDDPNP